jgi:hypothetical protein
VLDDGRTEIGVVADAVAADPRVDERQSGEKKDEEAELRAVAQATR